jgi:hypothetical protein
MKAMVATPCTTGKVYAEYTSCLVDSIKLCALNGIDLCPVFLGNESIIQIARNDLINIAYHAGVDLIWIDYDMTWNPEWIVKLLSSKEDVVAGTARKKTDLEETYAVKLNDFTLHDNGYMKCQGIGTAFMKMSSRAVRSVCEASESFTHHGKECRAVFDCKIVDGDFRSEEIVLCDKLKSLGFDIWLDPQMTCGHIGSKHYLGDIKQFIERIK